jgi:predicted RNA binding protein YcfA (HicA-like mRNA interferase family)
VAKLPRANGKNMVRFLEREGFQLVRVKGSHHYLARGEQRTSVPVHGNRPLKLGTLRNILRAIDMTPEDFADRFRN